MPRVLQLAARGSPCRSRTLNTRLLAACCLTCSRCPPASCRIGVVTSKHRQQYLNTLTVAPYVPYRNSHGVPLRHLHPDATRPGCSIGTRHSSNGPGFSHINAEYEDDTGTKVALSATDLSAIEQECDSRLDLLVGDAGFLDPESDCKLTIGAELEESDEAHALADFHDWANDGVSDDIQKEIAGYSHTGSSRWLRGTRGKNASRNIRKSRRSSRPGAIVNLMALLPQLRHYTRTPYHRLNLSYNYPHLRKSGGLRRRPPLSRLKDTIRIEQDARVTLYGILMRYVQSTAMSAEGAPRYELYSAELALLERHGYSLDHVIRWGASLTTPSARAALHRLSIPDERPPFFLLLIFLRRAEVPRLVLSAFMQQIDSRLQAEGVGWETLKILVIRLARHARVVWPEILPWIASLFTSEAARIHTASIGMTPTAKSSDVTRFSNVLLRLLSLPSTLKPVLSSFYQETAQFQVLRFMATRSPPLHVTRLGFQALTRTQLARTKTLQEREWATLKGSSWPPWIHQRTAMDEGKGYEQGISRATAIIHRSAEAGYPGGKWEELAAIYAGWNSDMSPTIQTRTSLPSLHSTRMSSQKLEQMIWAARVATTRTRAEAWACFLAQEASGVPPSSRVYHAMFGKVHHGDARGAHSPFATASHSSTTDVDAMLLPGDMKELIPEPESPLEKVFVPEPVPTWHELYTRMQQQGVLPSRRLSAYLLDTTPDFDLGLDMLHEAEKKFEGGIRQILDGSILQMSAHQLPNYFLAAFIRFLCRFGSFHGPPSVIPTETGPEQHRKRLQLDPHYLLEYAYALLVYLRPKYRPAWTAYMHKVVTSRLGAKKAKLSRKTTAQYRVVCALIDMMHEQGMEQDEEQFQLLCVAVHFAAQSARQGHLVNATDVEHLFSKAPSQIRTLFRSLVSIDASARSRPVASYIPSPSVLHSYVRALGVLSDYEGIYSFTTWATDNYLAISSRADCQHDGAHMLRRTLVTIRVALDGRVEGRMRQAPAALVQLIREQVESVLGWGGWPSDDEADRYMKHRVLAGDR